MLFALGVVQIVKAGKGSFLGYLDPRAGRRSWVRWSGRTGYATRGVVFLITAWLLLHAGIEEQANGTGGMARVLDWPTHPFDLIVGAGLPGFGIFSLVEARFRRLHDVPIDAVTRRFG